MKTINIKKSNDFSPNSKVIIHIMEKKIHIKGFGSFSFNLEPGQEFFASQQWTQSNRIGYNQINDGSTFIIKPRLGKTLALVTLMITIVCMVIFVLTRFRWSFLPLIPIMIYVFVHITINKNKYLIIKPIVENEKINHQ
jgi:predicted RND superfamily exporter protein